LCVGSVVSYSYWIRISKLKILQTSSSFQNLQNLVESKLKFWNTKNKKIKDRIREKKRTKLTCPLGPAHQDPGPTYLFAGGVIFNLASRMPDSALGKLHVPAAGADHRRSHWLPPHHPNPFRIPCQSEQQDSCPINANMPPSDLGRRQQRSGKLGLAASYKNTQMHTVTPLIFYALSISR
jgi:hypothetical protein